MLPTDTDTDLRRQVLETRKAEYERSLVNLEYEARTQREIGQVLKIDMSQELNQIKTSTRRVLAALKATERYLKELDAPAADPEKNGAEQLLAVR